MSSESDPIPFFDLLERVPASLGSDPRVRVEIPADWGQGRSSFGGALTGLGLRAMAAVVPGTPDQPARRCRSMLVSFVGPVAPGSVDLCPSVLRHGGSATQTSVTLAQDGATCCSILATFASPRASAIAVDGLARPELAGPEGLPALPFIPGVVPSFTRHFELRWATGGPPGSRLGSSASAGWARFREHRIGIGPAGIAALIDAWPAPVLQMLRAPAVASSVTWAIDFVDEDPEAASDDWWAFAVETDRARDGWAHTRARLWSPGGRLVATSTQTVAVFA